MFLDTKNFVIFQFDFPFFFFQISVLIRHFSLPNEKISLGCAVFLSYLIPVDITSFSKYKEFSIWSHLEGPDEKFVI